MSNILFLQLAYEIGRANDTLLGRQAFDLVDQRAGDDRAIGVSANLPDMRRAADPKPDREWQIGEAAHPIEKIGQAIPQIAPCAGDTSQRYAVDKATGEPPNLGDPFVGRSWRHEEDQIQPGSA